MTFYDRVNELCRERGISITALALALGFSKGTPSNWKTMTKPPRAENVKKVAEYFGVTVASLMGDSVVDVHSVHNNNGIIGNISSTNTHKEEMPIPPEGMTRVTIHGRDGQTEYADFTQEQIDLIRLMIKAKNDQK